MTITSYTPSNVETTTQPWASAGGGKTGICPPGNWN